MAIIDTAPLLVQLDESYQSAIIDEEFTEDPAKITKAIKGLFYVKKEARSLKSLRTNAIKHLTVEAAKKVTEDAPFVAPTEEEILAHIKKRQEEQKSAK